MSSVLRWARNFVALRPLVVRAARAPRPNLSAAAASSRGYAAQQQQQQQQQQKARRPIEPLLQRLDEDARKYGRLARKDLDELCELIRVTTTVTSSQSLLVIRCCGGLMPEESPAERTKLVDQIWKILSERRIPMDVSHYNALLRVYIENENRFSADDFLKQMENKGIEPNRVTYQRIMQHHCQAGDIEGASKVLELMREKSMPLTENVLNALVLGHVRQSNMEGARSVLTAMSAAGLTPSAETYTILMGGAARKGDVEGVREIMGECERQELYFSDRDFMDVIEEFAVGGHPEHVSFMLERMQKTAGYNQEAINLILRLVNRRCESVALQVLKSLTKSFNQTADTVPAYQSAFYIRHLVKTETPNETILAHCKELYEKGLAPKAYYVAIEEAHSRGNVDLSMQLLNALHSIGDPVRHHYFWPALVSRYNQSGAQGLLDIVRRQSVDFQMPPSTETLREYVVPYLYKGDPMDTVMRLRENGAVLSTSVRGVLMHLLNENELRKAADFSSTYGTKTPLRTLIVPLAKALRHTKDLESFVKVVSLAHQMDDASTNAKTNQADDAEEVVVEEDANHAGRDSVGRLINALVAGRRLQLEGVQLADVLRRFHAHGLGITDEWAAKILQNIGDKITEDVSELLSKLTADDLRTVAVELNPAPTVRRSPDQLVNLIRVFEKKGDTPTALRKQLLVAYARAKDVDKLEETLRTTLESGFVLTAGMKCLMMDTYVQVGQLEKALDYRRQILEAEPDFAIDSIKILRMALLMIKEDKLEDSLQLLKQVMPESDEKKTNFLQNSLCWQILNTFAEKGDVDKVKLFFNIFVENKYSEPTNLLLGTMIKAHAVKGDTKAALEEFEQCCNTYRSTPWKNELSKRLIMEEDANGLQKLTDLSTVIHGEVNSLYDLVFVFIECGRLKQARKILETPGMRTRNQRFNSVCERYSQEGKVECLEGLLEATRELSHIDRTEVFQQLLKNYIQTGNTEKALGLWTLLQEENVPPTDKFLTTLAQFLKSKKVAIPFVVPQTGNVSVDKQSKQASESSKPKLPSTGKNLKLMLNNAISEGKYNEAVKIVKEIVRDNKSLPTNVLVDLVAKLSNEGSVALLDDIGGVLTDKQKTFCRFNNRRVVAIVNAGLSQGYLAELENFVNNAENSENFQTKLSTGSTMTLLAAEDSYSKVKSIAEKMAKFGYTAPIHAVWTHAIIKNDLPEAQQIWNDHVSGADIIFFRAIYPVAKETKNVQLLERVLKFLEGKSSVTPGAIGSLYSKQVEILADCEKFDEIVNLLEKIQKDGFSLSNLHARTMENVKSAFEKAGRKFEYKLE